MDSPTMDMKASDKVHIHNRDGLGQVEDLRAGNGRIVIGVPTEVLCEIFKLIYMARESSKSSTPPQFTLSHVNHRWRSIILDMPELWTAVEIRRCDADVLQEVLRRSKARPLNVIIDIVKTTSTTATIETLMVLKPEMGRCRSITMFAPRTTYKLVCGAFGYELSAPHLSSLELTCHRSIEYQGEGYECLFPQITFNPQVLGHVLLDGVCIPSADFSGVETMVVRNLQACWLPLSLGQSNALQSISVFNTSLTWRTKLITSRLKDITLDWQNVSTVLTTQWSAPTLENLTISNASGAVWHDLRFYLTGNPQPAMFVGLKGLRLKDCDAVTMARHLEVTPFVRALPSLTSLELVNTNPGLVLACLGRDPQMCPHLTTIQIDGKMILRSEVSSLGNVQRSALEGHLE